MVLENKLGIINAAELARVEEQISKRKAWEIFETGFLNSLEVELIKPYRKFMIIYSEKFMNSLEKSVM